MVRGPERIVHQLRERSGDALRSIGIYDATGYRTLYLREDVERTYAEQDLPSIVNTLQREAQERSADGWVFPLGKLQATLRIFDGAVVLHLPRDEESGTIVSLDLGAAAQLVGFVAECREDLYAEP